MDTHGFENFRKKRIWERIWTSTGCSESRFLDLGLVPARNHYKLWCASFPRNLYYHTALTSDPKHWPSGWFSEDYKIKKAVIVLGAPYSIWQERLKLRGKEHYHQDAIAKFIKIYTRAITRLEQMNDIPYILVDNRNDYPILDKAEFLTMLTEEN